MFIVLLYINININIYIYIYIPLNPLPGVETNVYCFTGLLVCWFANCVAAVWLLCFDDIYLVAGVTSYMLARSSVRHLLRSYAPHVQICWSTKLSKYTYNETTSAGNIDAALLYKRGQLIL